MERVNAGRPSVAGRVNAHRRQLPRGARGCRGRPGKAAPVQDQRVTKLGTDRPTGFSRRERKCPDHPPQAHRKRRPSDTVPAHQQGNCVTVRRPAFARDPRITMRRTDSAEGNVSCTAREPSPVRRDVSPRLCTRPPRHSRRPMRRADRRYRCSRDEHQQDGPAEAPKPHPRVPQHEQGHLQGQVTRRTRPARTTHPRRSLHGRPTQVYGRTALANRQHCARGALARPADSKHGEGTSALPI